MPAFKGKARPRRLILDNVKSASHFLPTRRIPEMRPATCSPSAVVAVNGSPIAASSPISASKAATNCLPSFGDAVGAGAGVGAGVSPGGAYDTVARSRVTTIAVEPRAIHQLAAIAIAQQQFGSSRHHELYLTDAGALVHGGFPRGRDAYGPRRVVHADFQTRDIQTGRIEPRRTHQRTGALPLPAESE